MSIEKPKRMELPNEFPNIEILYFKSTNSIILDQKVEVGIGRYGNLYKKFEMGINNALPLDDFNDFHNFLKENKMDFRTWLNQKIRGEIYAKSKC